MIEIDATIKRYDGNTVVDSVSLDIGLATATIGSTVERMAARRVGRV